MPRLETRGQLPVLALDVVNSRYRPRSASRHDQADALTAACPRKAENVRWSFMALVVGAGLAQHHAVRVDQPRMAGFTCCRPTRRSIGPRVLCISRAPE